MTEDTARIIIEVVAGLIPGTPMPEYTKRWAVTSDEWYADEGAAVHIAEEREQAANEYANELRRGGLNWVRVDWLWL